MSWVASIAPDALAARLGGAGIGPGTTVVLYGDPVQYGAYALWALTMGGHADLRLLDGGRNGWIGEGRPTTREVPRFEAVAYAPRVGDSSMRVGRDELRANLGRPGRLLLDMRSPEEYAGERVMPPPDFDHGAERAGRIPGAVHLYYRDLLNDDDSFKSPAALRAIFDAVGAAPGRAGEIIAYCRLSHRAALAWFAMTHLLGYADVRNL